MTDALSPGSHVAGYRLERLLGAGGMGEVYLARDETLDRAVALKLIAPALADDERYRRRLLEESRRAAQLEHPAIVPVYGAGEDGGRLYLAMRYVAGGTLADRLAAVGRMEPALAAALLAPVAEALDAAHAVGLVHRDVKPANVLLDRDRGMLADFGLAVRAASPDSLTREDGLSGTLSYLAPEQIEGDGVSGASDQYSLACVLFEAICGAPPFSRESDVALIYAHLSDRPPDASGVRPGVSRAVDAALARGLAKRPQDRFGSCAALVDAVRRGAEAPAATGRRRRWLIAAGAVAVMAVAGAAAVIETQSGGATAAPKIAAGQLVMLDQATGKATRAVDVGQRPGAIAVGDGGIWVAETAENQIVRVDPESGQITQTIATGGPVNDLRLADGALWATIDLDRDLLRIDPGSGQISQRIAVGNSPGAIAATPGALWVTSRLDGTVSRVDPATGDVGKPIPIGTGVTALTAAFGSVWANSEDQASVTRIDAATGQVLDTIPVGHSPTAFAVTRKALWIANRTDGTVSRLDPARNAITATVTVGREPAALATDGDAVLVADGSDGALYRIGPGGAAPRRIAALGAVPAALAQTATSTLATTDDLPSSHRGGTFVMADQEDLIVTDPAMDSTNPTTWVWDSLVRYRRVAGSAGFDLVPDLATSIPRPTDGGRTYVFHVRPGIRYSTGRVVRPSDFALALRRIMQGIWTVPDGPTGSFLRFSLHSLDGVSGCVADPQRAPCDPSRAIAADDAAGTVTYHLAHADSDFLHALAGTGVPVPPGTPMRTTPTTPVPGTGPYMITVNDRHHALYVRNPYFRVWSADARPDGNVDRIDWLKDVSQAERPGDTTDEVAMVESGKADSAYKVLSPADTERVLRLYPSRVHLTPFPGGFEVGYAFRLDRPPFASADVRRAVSLAIDRSRIAEATPQFSRPTCRTIGAGIPGYLPTCPYTVDHQPGGPPDITRARALLRRAGAVGQVVHMASWTRVADPLHTASPYKRWDDQVIAAMRSIGLKVVVKRFAPEDGDGWSQYDGDLSMHFGSGEGGEDGRDAIADITEECPAHLDDPSAFCDATTRRLWHRAVSLPDGADKVRALTAVDDHLTAEAAWLPLSTTINVVFLSKRAGNYGYQPATGGSLWDRMTVR